MTSVLPFPCRSGAGSCSLQGRTSSRICILPGAPDSVIRMHRSPVPRGMNIFRQGWNEWALISSKSSPSYRERCCPVFGMAGELQPVPCQNLRRSIPALTVSRMALRETGAASASFRNKVFLGDIFSMRRRKAAWGSLLSSNAFSTVGSNTSTLFNTHSRCPGA